MYLRYKLTYDFGFQIVSFLTVSISIINVYDITETLIFFTDNFKKG
jgi:hypothetical protein